MKAANPHRERKKPSETAEYTEGVSYTTVALSSAKVIPEVVQKVTEKAQLIIAYNAKPISNGKELTPSETQEEPQIDIKGTETYTLVMVDPDAPSPDAPKFRYFVHWLVTNIPGVDVQRGDVIVDYMGPVRLTPPDRKLSDCRIIAIQRLRRANWDFTKVYGPQSPPKGKHRYIFILYPQQGRMSAKSPKSRQNFTLHQFEKEHNLGDPADVKFFHASPE